jgi:hypothetical protein
MALTSRRVASSLVAVLLGWTVGGCSNDDDSQDSDTPRVTVAAPDAADAELFLTETDLRDIGFDRITAGELEDVPLFENPDPRGPCGGSVPPVPLTGAIGRTFAQDDVVLVELVSEAGPDAEAYLAALRADTGRAPCDGFQSQTNTGATQAVSDIAVVDLTTVGDGALAWTSSITVSGIKTTAGAVALLAGDHLAFIQVHSAITQLTPIQLQLIAERAAERLLA